MKKNLNDLIVVQAKTSDHKLTAPDNQPQTCEEKNQTKLEENLLSSAVLCSLYSRQKEERKKKIKITNK